MGIIYEQRIVDSVGSHWKDYFWITREEILIINDKINYYSRIRNPVDAYFHLIPGEKIFNFKSRR